MAARVHDQIALIDLQLMVAHAIRLRRRQVIIEIPPQRLAQIRHGGAVPCNRKHRAVQPGELAHQGAGGQLDFVHPIIRMRGNFDRAVQLRQIRLHRSLHFTQCRSCDARNERGAEQTAREYTLLDVSEHSGWSHAASFAVIGAKSRQLVHSNALEACRHDTT